METLLVSRDVRFRCPHCHKWMRVLKPNAPPDRRALLSGDPGAPRRPGRLRGSRNRHLHGHQNPALCAEIHRMRRGGSTLQAIGTRFCLTRERVRQLLRDFDPDGRRR
jgi:hypothetical protein